MTMRYVLERVMPPSEEPVTLAELRDHMREFSSVTDNDAKYTACGIAAREWLEDYTGRALVDQTWRLTIGDTLYGAYYGGGDLVGGFRGPFVYRGIWDWLRMGEIWLRKAPVLAITKFVSVDADGAETDIDAATYALREGDSKWPRLVAKSGATWCPWLPGTCMRIEYRAGYVDLLGSPSLGDVPGRFKQAILLYAESLFDRDEKMMGLLQSAAESLICSERVEMGFA
jgi:hypothetical protein